RRGKISKEVGHRLEDAYRVAAHRGTARLSELRQELGELTLPDRTRPRLARFVVELQSGSQYVDPGSEGQSPLSLVSVPVQHTAPAPLHLTNELFGQPGFADAGLAQDYDGPAPSAQCSAERFMKRGELLVSIDQGGVTCWCEKSLASCMGFCPRLGSNL